MHMLTLLAMSLALSPIAARAETAFRNTGWEERMLRKLDQKMTVELQDTKLTEGMDFISKVTGLNIIIDPKIRVNDPPITLKVNDMDAGHVIKWMTTLSSTHAEVMENVIFITTKDSEAAKRSANEEREQIMQMAARMGHTVDIPQGDHELTDQERTEIALALWQKEDHKPQDFPGPEIGLPGFDGTNAFGGGGGNAFGVQVPGR